MRHVDAQLTPTVERALEMCGRDRVMHNDGSPPMMAIRWGDVKIPPEARWLTAEGKDHNEAGAKVAKQFADAMRAQGERLIEWADNIDAALESGKESSDAAR